MYQYHCCNVNQPEEYSWFHEMSSSLTSTCKALEVPVFLKLFEIILFVIKVQLCNIHLYVNFSDRCLIFPLEVIFFFPLAIQSSYTHLILFLNGLLTDMSNGCSINPSSPGIITRSVLPSESSILTSLIRCPWKLSSKNMAFFE